MIHQTRAEFFVTLENKEEIIRKIISREKNFSLFTAGCRFSLCILFLFCLQKHGKEICRWNWKQNGNYWLTKWIEVGGKVSKFCHKKDFEKDFIRKDWKAKLLSSWGLKKLILIRKASWQSNLDHELGISTWKQIKILLTFLWYCNHFIFWYHVVKISQECQIPSRRSLTNVLFISMGNLRTISTRKPKLRLLTVLSYQPRKLLLCFVI